jgi:MFS family permease
LSTASALPAPPIRFAALRVADCRTYLVGGALSMMADNIEHVITYWVLWQKFHSPALVGFEVVSHWLPFLLFSVTFGALADRFDCRRVVQSAQALFMLVSVLWGVMFLTGTTTVWAACVLLVLHGCAGSLWGPGEQLLLHDFVGPETLPSAVRLNATFRSLGILFGPVVGSALLLGLGPVVGIFVNAAIYLPLTLFLFVTKATGHRRDLGDARQRIGLFDAGRVLRDVSGDRVIIEMILLAALASFFIGQSLQSAMPAFADQWSDPTLTYGVLLFGAGAGGVVGGFVLEATGWVRPTVRSAVVSTLVFGLATFGFAVTGSLVFAVLLLFGAGVANIASMSVGQTIVQLRADPAMRGRVIGLYGMAANGLRVGSGVIVGFVGAVIGIHVALALSCAALVVGAALVALLMRRRRVHPVA